MPETTDTALVPQPPGLQVDLLKCSRASRSWVFALSTEVRRLREENERLREEVDAAWWSLCHDYGCDTPEQMLDDAEEGDAVTIDDGVCQLGQIALQWREERDDLSAEVDRLKDTLSAATEELASNLTIIRKLRIKGLIPCIDEQWQSGYERGLVEGLQALGKDDLLGKITKATAAEAAKEKL